MNPENKKINWVLWTGIAIPVIVLIFVAIFAYMPNNLVTRYDFLYYFTNYNDYGYRCYSNGETYKVKDQMVSVASSSDYTNNDSFCLNKTEVDPPKIYRYDVLAEKSTPISLTDAQKLKIDNNKISPDGLSIQNGNYYNSGIFELFGGGHSNYDKMYFRNNKNELKEINLNSANGDYYYNFRFIGWVI